MTLSQRRVIGALKRNEREGDREIEGEGRKGTEIEGLIYGVSAQCQMKSTTPLMRKGLEVQI